MIEKFVNQLRTVAADISPTGVPQLDDDALIYQGSATVEAWQCHVPAIVASMWPMLSEETRLVAYIGARRAVLHGDPLSRTSR